MSASETRKSLGNLLDRLVAECERACGGVPKREHIPDWRSPCEIGNPGAGELVSWLPLDRPVRGSFKGVERALEVKLHADIKAYYTSFWSDCFEAKADEGNLTLIQVWNDADFERLCENILGHALAKRRAKAPLTVFFACTDEDELMLSVDNHSGEVVLENPGEKPVRVVESSLAAFLDRVHPVMQTRAC